MINIGIIGLGGIAKGMHVPKIRESGKFFIKAAADVREDHPFVKELDIPEYYLDYNEMLKDPQIDAVLVLSPHDMHEEHCVAAFNAGKHVLIEKPISRNLKEASAIIDAQKKSGKVGMMGFCQRFYPSHAYIKKMIDENALGNLLSARVDHYQDSHPKSDSWWNSPERAGGGAVIGSGVHRLDLLRWYMGEVKSVYAKASYEPSRLMAEVCTHAVLEFKSGAIANFSINWAAPSFTHGEKISVSGKEGIAVFAKGRNLKAAIKSINDGDLFDIDTPPCETMYEHFAKCIKENKEPMVNLEEGYKSLQLVRAIYKSIETGLPVNPEEITF